MYFMKQKVYAYPPLSDCRYSLYSEEEGTSKEAKYEVPWADLCEMELFTWSQSKACVDQQAQEVPGSSKEERLYIKPCIYHELYFMQMIYSP